MKNKSNLLALSAILSIYFLQTGPNAISPALETIFSVFGAQGFSLTVLLLISTLPSLSSLPATIFSGAVAGKKVKFKTLAIVGTILFLVGGLTPAFSSSYVMILIERGIFGIAIGLINPLGAALIQSAYEGDKRAKLLGLGTLVMNLGGITLTLVAGYLANFGWNYTFYVHSIAIVSLILVILFLPEPEIKEDTEITAKQKEKVSIPGIVWISCILFGVLFMFNFTIQVNASTLLAERSLGNSTIAAVVIALFTGGGMIAGALFGGFYKVTKRYVFTISLLLGTIGFALVVYGNNVAMIMAGQLLTGFSMFSIMSGVFLIIGMVASPSSFALCNSILFSSMGIFSFLATYWVGMIANITGDGTTQPIFLGMICIAVFCLVFAIINPLPKANKELTE